MKLHFNVSYDDVKNNQQPTVYYSAQTRWWTDDPADLCTTKPLPKNIRPAGAGDNYGAGLPCDIFGCVLFEIPKANFLVPPERLVEVYGDVDVLMAMHHKNFTPDPGEKKELFTKVEYFQMAVKAFKEVRLPTSKHQVTHPPPRKAAIKQHTMATIARVIEHWIFVTEAGSIGHLYACGGGSYYKTTTDYNTGWPSPVTETVEIEFEEFESIKKKYLDDNE